MLLLIKNLHKALLLTSTLFKLSSKQLPCFFFLSLFLSPVTSAKDTLRVGYAAAAEDFYKSSELHAVKSEGWLELYLRHVTPKSQHFSIVNFNSPELLKKALYNNEIDIAFSDRIYFQGQDYQVSDSVLSSTFLAVTKKPIANLKVALNNNMVIHEYKGIADFDFASRVAPHIAKQIKPSVLLLQALRNITAQDIYVIPEILHQFLPNSIKHELTKLSVNRLAISQPANYAFIASNKEHNALLDSLNSAISTLGEATEEELLQLAVNKIFFPALKHSRSDLNKIEFTEAEQLWLQSSPIIKVASVNSSASSPFDIIDINNTYTGISADYLKLIGQITGLKFVHTGNYSMQNMLYGYQEKSWDLFSTIPHDTAKHLSIFQLSEPYSYYSWNVIARKEIEVNSESDLLNLTFAPLPYSASGTLTQDNPNMRKLAMAKSVEEALALVSSGEADFTILPSHSAAKQITASDADNLRVAFAFNSLKETIHFGVRKDLRPLKQIIDKAIKSISKQQHESIRNKWFGGNYTVELDWEKALKQSSPLIIAITCLVVALFAWSRKLRQEVKNRIKIQNQLEIANAQAKQATKAKSLFLSTMSHEIRTPMNGIIGMLELLSESKLTTEQKRMLTTINASSNSLMQIINDILDFSKIESDKLEIESIPYSLGQELESICDAMTKLALDKGVGLYLEIEPSLYGLIKGDPTRFRQVINNLLSNAIKFTDHGQVSVIASFDKCLDHDEEIVIFVKDTGIGMSKQQLDKLFQPFTQAESSTTRRFGGTGLGLAITQQLCKLMSFKLSVVSETGHGTAFCLRVPLTQLQSSSSVELWQPSCLIINQNTSLNKLLESNLTNWQIPYRKVGVELQFSTLIEMANNADYILLNIDDAYRLKFPLDEFEAKLKSKLVKMTSQSVREHTSLSFNPLLPSLLKQKLSSSDELEAIDSSKDHKLMTISKSEAEEQGLLVLVAEDHPTNRLVLQKQLKALGIHADFAEDGQQAWANLQMKNYGLLLTDCHMPNMDGYTLAEKIRLSDQFKEPELPVIALTASVLDADKKKCIEAGMNDVITKPATIEMLRQTLSEWLKPVLVNDKDDIGNQPIIINKEQLEQNSELSQESSIPLLYDHALIEQMFGESTGELLQEFIDTLDLDITKLMKCKPSELTQISDIAHRVKGAGETIMASNLVAKATVLERAVSEDEVDTLRSELIQAANQLSEEMSKQLQ